MTSRAHQLTGPDRWQISYADLLTLLLGFFIVMYSISSLEAEKKAQVITALKNGFVSPSSNVSISSQFVLPFNDDYFDIESQGSWIYVTVASEALFDSASAKLTTIAKKELKSLLPIILAQTGIVEVEGHTDSLPINTSQFPNNWSLSSARAVSVVDFLVSSNNQVDGKRFRAIGYGQYSPAADNSVAEGRAKNRRVVIKIENKDPSKMPRLFEDNFPPIIDTTRDVGNIITNVNASNNALLAEYSDKKAIGKKSNYSKKINKNIKLKLQERLDEKGIKAVNTNSGGIKFSKD